MTKAFAKIAFTPAVRQQQARHGSARAYDRALAPETDAADRLGEAEKGFVEGRDGFYQATVSESGWPYVQFRGGPVGLLRVLDPKTIAYADFRGNRQYVSLGNLTGDDRVSIILMDYANRRRLKIFGRAGTIDLAEDPGLVAGLHVAGYQARPERAVIITVEGFDWNCPAHIPRRLTPEELEPHLAPLRDELARLAAENARLKAALRQGSAVSG